MKKIVFTAVPFLREGSKIRENNEKRRQKCFIYIKKISLTE
jgi:hypothetical protein